MNVTNLLVLLQDLRPNTQLYWAGESSKILGVSSISLVKTNENNYLVLNGKTPAQATLKAWELKFLLQTYPATLALYFNTQKGHQPIFGIRFADGAIYLK
ncbi:hypothetical protein HU830_06250 [Lactobacillus sp. DCY120]|uniref:Uncharacterized protein n=1 Tax=Bombilactobacillus apium TaxID=2675299 RepID=A0A850R887_9LACO|nr:hypothetical protein [Bombilactobacillus apium]NVY96755.1 hypothetical protein [Bombilactobacillus apium]